MNPISILAELKAIGLKQSYIAKEVGCSQPTISDMAAGKVGMTRPSFRVINGLQQLAQKHGIEFSLAVLPTIDPD